MFEPLWSFAIAFQFFFGCNPSIQKAERLYVGVEDVALGLSEAFSTPDSCYVSAAIAKRIQDGLSQLYEHYSIKPISIKKELVLSYPLSLHEKVKLKLAHLNKQFNITQGSPRIDLKGKISVILSLRHLFLNRHYIVNKYAQELGLDQSCFKFLPLTAQEEISISRCTLLDEKKVKFHVQKYKKDSCVIETVTI